LSSSSSSTSSSSTVNLSTSSTSDSSSSTSVSSSSTSSSSTVNLSTSSTSISSLSSSSSSSVSEVSSSSSTINQSTSSTSVSSSSSSTSSSSTINLSTSSTSESSSSTVSTSSSSSSTINLSTSSTSESSSSSSTSESSLSTSSSTSISTSSSSGFDNLVPNDFADIEDDTTSTTITDIAGSDLSITLVGTSHIMAFMSVEMSNTVGGNSSFYAIQINGVDSTEIERFVSTAGFTGNAGVTFRTASALSPGTYTVRGRHRTEGGTLSSHIELMAIGLEDGLGNQIPSVYSAVTDSVSATTLQQVSGLLQQMDMPDSNKHMMSVIAASMSVDMGSGTVNLQSKVANQNEIASRTFGTNNGAVTVINRTIDTAIFGNNPVDGSWSTTAGTATGDPIQMSGIGFACGNDRKLDSDRISTSGQTVSGTVFEDLLGSETGLTVVNPLADICMMVAVSASIDTASQTLFFRIVTDGMVVETFERTFSSAGSAGSMYKIYTVSNPGTGAHEMKLQWATSGNDVTATIASFQNVCFATECTADVNESSQSSIEFSSFTSSSSSESSLEFSSFSKSSSSSSTAVSVTSSSSSSTQESGVTSSSSSSLEFSSFSSSSSFVSFTSSSSSSSSTEVSETSSQSSSSVSESSLSSLGESSSSSQTVSSSSSRTITSSSSSSPSSIEFSSFTSSSSSSETTIPVTWNNFIDTGPIAPGNTLEKFTGPNAYVSGAESDQVLVSGAGYVEWTVEDITVSRKYLGLARNPDPSDGGRNAADWGINQSNNDFQVRELGIQVFNDNNIVAVNDVLRIQVNINGTVDYLHNGAVLYTSAVLITYPVRVDASIRDLGTRILNAVLHGNWQVL